MKETMKSAIARAMEKQTDAVEPAALYKSIGARDQAAFTATLRSLEADGKLIVTKKGKLLSARSSGLTPAKIVSQSKGFAFARPADGGADIFIPTEHLKGALLGDTVMLHKLYDTDKGRNGSVERILVKGSRTLTGTISRFRGGCELIPDSAFRFNIPIERGAMLGARNGDKVQAVLSSRPHRSGLTARVLHIYGKASSAKVCADAILDANAIPVDFPPEVLESARTLAEKGIRAEELQNRLDLRDELIFTIDGADAKDLDDAVSISKTREGWTLGVHIADVSHYVRANSPLDREAQRRGTSVYFADRVVPMLPKELSNGLCSLHPGEDKLAFSALLRVSKKGELLSCSFRKTVIRSKVRGVYSEVNRIFDGSADASLKTKYKPVLASLKAARALAQVLKDCAGRRGTMELESGESRFELDERGVCVGLSARSQGEAEEMIEQLMILANQAAARLARERGLPFVYRVHEAPDPERVRTLSELAGALGLANSRIREGASTGDFARLLEQSKDTPAARVISHQILRTMAKARYDFRPLGHFGLALEDYCHFTSPIRRYPDTAIHRILSDAVAGEPDKKLTRKYTEFAASAASESSICELRALTAEREAEKCYMAEYMTAHIGEEYDGVISGVTARGLFVELPNSAEGYVSLDAFPGCRFRFDGLTCHTDEISGRRLAIGGALRVRVIAASVAEGTVDFEPVE